MTIGHPLLGAFVDHPEANDVGLLRRFDPHDVATSEMEVVDPRHPVMAGAIDRSRSKEIDHTWSVQEASSTSPMRSHASSGAGATKLERKDFLRAAPAKLSLDALQDLIALPEENGGTCPSNLERSGAVCWKALLQAIPEDLGQVLREIRDELGTRQAGSPGTQSSGLCATINATPSDYQSRKLKLQDALSQRAPELDGAKPTSM
ncbi:hypothetical protein [Bradyrhizobium sp. RT5a]|uniref:hypothetical protein n=1 Tax=unclassified Bradyrhizobium TaxID=2631580 RepID=UPI003399B28F